MTLPFTPDFNLPMTCSRLCHSFAPSGAEVWFALTGRPVAATQLGEYSLVAAAVYFRPILQYGGALT